MVTWIFLATEYMLTEPEMRQNKITVMAISPCIGYLRPIWVQISTIPQYWHFFFVVYNFFKSNYMILLVGQALNLYRTLWCEQISQNGRNLTRSHTVHLVL